jgi:hypothetical protein
MPDHARGQEFQRHHAVQARIDGAEHLAHAARAEQGVKMETSVDDVVNLVLTYGFGLGLIVEKSRRRGVSVCPQLPDGCGHLGIEAPVQQLAPFGV